MKNYIIKSYCKINLSLNVLKKLKSGYHRITSLITFCNLHDIISISKIEFLEVTVNITHGDWGNLHIVLTRSGESTQSSLAINHNCYSSAISSTAINCTVSGNTFTFATVRHLDEGLNDTWTLYVQDAENDGTTGTLASWSLKAYGR